MRIKPVDLGLLLARLGVGGILIYAGFLKAVGPAPEFAALLGAYKLFPAPLLKPLSIGLPYVEMWVGLFLVTGFYTRWAALASSLLAAAFLISVGSTFARGIDLGVCGCFGPQSLTPKHTFALDIILLAFSIFSYRASRAAPFLSLDRQFQ